MSHKSKLGKYTMPWICVDGITITPSSNKHYNLGTNYGVLVVDVLKEGPDHKTGF